MTVYLSPKVTLKGTVFMQFKAPQTIAALVIAAASLITSILPTTAMSPNKDKETPVRLIGLTSDNKLVSFRTDRTTSLRNTRIKNIDGQVVGIDVRPCQGSKLSD